MSASGVLLGHRYIVPIRLIHCLLSKWTTAEIVSVAFTLHKVIARYFFCLSQYRHIKDNLSIITVYNAKNTQICSRSRWEISYQFQNYSRRRFKVQLMRGVGCDKKNVELWTTPIESTTQTTIERRCWGFIRKFMCNVDRWQFWTRFCRYVASKQHCNDKVKATRRFFRNYVNKEWSLRQYAEKMFPIQPTTTSQSWPAS